MNPQETGKHYDAIASWWNANQDTMDAGLRYLDRAIGYCSYKRNALDVGCGSGGRIISALEMSGFTVTGVDVSRAMLHFAAERHPHASFVCADIAEWVPPAAYDLIVAWDSTFHLPHASQGPVIKKLCGALAPGGVLLFTAGAVNGETSGEMAGETFYYSSLGTARYIALLEDNACSCLYLERDQYPELHIVVIAQRVSS